ncbi:MAG: hypothetical protein NZ772_08635 [Cyanobacteria bacterium]|nr:hypothetical protein [Cyanobacteriota bacterium]MDW8201545.1 hypothetical protein [Cyanobacteriota bacterium SKYGB_h_bin112]
MRNLTYDDPATLADILSFSSRPRYLLQATYNITPENITSLQVDSDNYKIDVHTEAETFRFKAQSLENVIMKNSETGEMSLEFDPALAQGICSIIEDYAPDNEA